jgi:hypothetical protein
MRKKDDNMMLFVSDDLQGDLGDDNEDLIFEILDDLVGLVEGNEWISIWEIYCDDFLGDDLGEDEQRYVSEKILKKLSKSVLKIRI